MTMRLGGKSPAGRRANGGAPIAEMCSAVVPRGGSMQALAGLVCHGPQPCEGCPFTDGSKGPWPRIGVFARRGGYCVVTSTRSRRGFHVRQWLLSDGLFQKLLDARISRLVDRSGLTVRERETFAMILTGRSPREMADALGVSVRTVKFHQANLLQKLGADSRADLLRVIL